MRFNHTLRLKQGSEHGQGSALTMLQSRGFAPTLGFSIAPVALARAMIYLSIYHVNNLGFFRDIADENSFELETSNFQDRLEVISGRPVPIFVALT